MGRALEPGIKVTLVLDYDKDKPIATRPVFHTRALSMREAQRLSEAYDEYFETLRNTDAGPQQLVDGAVELLMSFVTGWDNQRHPVTGDLIPFSREAFPDVLLQSEAFELVRKAISGTGLSVEEKKSTESLA